MTRKTNRHADDQIINAFFRRDEKAIKEVATVYGTYLFKIAFNILGSSDDSDECVNDVYLRLWNSIPPDRPDNFKAYIAKIARNTALDKQRERSAKKRIPSEYITSLEELDECIPEENDRDSECEAKLLKEAIDGFVRSLSKRQQYMFVCRYFYGDPVDDIARGLKISGSLVYHELSVIRSKLKEKLIKEALWNENRSS